MCIFRNILLNIRTIIYDCFIVICLFVRLTASGCVRGTWYLAQAQLGKEQNNPKRCIDSEVILVAAISDVEVKKIKSVG